MRFAILMTALAIGLGATWTPSRALAQAELRGEAVSHLPELVHMGREAFEAELTIALPELRIERGSRPDGAFDDPLFWTIRGAFGPVGDGIPAGLVHCARYGLATRDLLTSRAVSDPEIFPILIATRAEADDAEIWPDEAIALLRCSFAWDDARRIRPWRRSEAEVWVQDLFTAITRRDDASIRAQSGQHIRDQYGTDGFRIIGRDGPRRSYYWWESLEITRQLSHQRVAFRVFLLSGGV